MAVSAGGKTLLTPQPRLQTAFFSTIEAAANIPAGVQLMVAGTSSGAAKSGEPVGLNADLKVDLIECRLKRLPSCRSNNRCTPGKRRVSPGRPEISDIVFEDGQPILR